MKKLIKLLLLLLLVPLIVHGEETNQTRKDLIGIIGSDYNLKIDNYTIYINDDNYDTMGYFVETYINQLPSVQNYLETHSSVNPKVRAYCISKTNCGICITDDNYTNDDHDDPNYKYPLNGCIEYQMDVKTTNSADASLLKYSSQLELKKLYLFDMGTVNFIHNFSKNENIAYVQSITDENRAIEYFDIENDEMYSYFPEIKSLKEEYKDIKILQLYNGTAGFGSSVFSFEYKGVIYPSFSLVFDIRSFIFVEDTVSDDNMLSVAQEKLKGYCKKVECSLTETTEYTNNISEISETLNNAFGTQNVNYTSKVVKLKIGSKVLPAYIIKVSNDKIKTYNKTKSTALLNSGTITISSSALDVPFDIIVTAEDVTSKYKNNIIQKAYDIKAYSGLNPITQTDGEFEIMLPVENIDSKTNKIYYLDDEGNIKETFDFETVTDSGKQYAKFTTTHLSVYAIGNVENENKNTVENENKNTAEKENPKTGAILPISIALVSSTALVFLVLINKKKGIFKI